MIVPVYPGAGFFKVCFGLALALVGADSLHAQSVQYRFNDGKDSVYNLTSVRKITFDMSRMYMQMRDGSTYTWPLNTIGKMTYRSYAAQVEPNPLNIHSINLTTFPNPTDGRLTVRFLLLQPDVITLQCQDMNGKLLAEKPLGQRHSGEVQEWLELQFLPPGTYLLSVCGKYGTHSKPFIRQ